LKDFSGQFKVHESEVVGDLGEIDHDRILDAEMNAYMALHQVSSADLEEVPHGVIELIDRSIQRLTGVGFSEERQASSPAAANTGSTRPAGAKGEAASSLIFSFVANILDSVKQAVVPPMPGGDGALAMAPRSAELRGLEGDAPREVTYKRLREGKAIIERVKSEGLGFVPIGWKSDGEGSLLELFLLDSSRPPSLEVRVDGEAIPDELLSKHSANNALLVVVPVPFRPLAEVQLRRSQGWNVTIVDIRLRAE
jgi:hypothetical protein